MNRPSTAREALIVEAIGEVAQLIDRVDAVAPAMDEARLALVQASAELASQIVAFENRMNAITENVKVQAVRHIAHRMNEVARHSLDLQTQAMQGAAQDIFRTQMDSTLQRLVMPLQRLAERLDRPWESWLTHAATAAAASAATWALSAYLWAR